MDTHFSRTSTVFVQAHDGVATVTFAGSGFGARVAIVNTYQNKRPKAQADWPRVPGLARRMLVSDRTVPADLAFDFILYV